MQNQSDTTKNIVANISKPAMVALSAGVIYGTMSGFGGSVDIFGIPINHVLIETAAAGAGSFLGSVANNNVVPYLSANPAMASLVMLATPVGTGLGTAGAMVALSTLTGGSTNMRGMAVLFGIGAASEAIGSYGHNSIVQPWLDA